MVRYICVLAGGLLVNSPVIGVEPAQPPRLVVVHGAEAEYWLNRLGEGYVRVESLVSDPTEGNEWAAAERQIKRLTFPAAFVTCPCADDTLARFWADRLYNQGGVEIVTLEALHAIHRLEHQSYSIQKIHRLLVKLCPEGKATLDERLRGELLRVQPAITRNEPLASR